MSDPGACALSILQLPTRHDIKRLRFSQTDLDAVVAVFGPGDTPAERQFRLRLADTRRCLREFL